MMRALSTAVSGMQAQEQKLDQIANDMANMNTTAFKRGRTEFQDMMYQTIKEPGGEAGQNQVPVGIQVGSGTKVAAQYFIHEQGPTRITNGHFDLAINGDGFFAVQAEGGQTAYTRDGSFKMDSQGRVVTSGGYPIIPALQIPQGIENVTITPNGIVRGTDSQGMESQLGEIQLVGFINPSAMKRVGTNLMTPTSASGPPVQGTPGENSLGLIQQGALEGSNVKPTEAIMDMISTQRAFEMNSKMVKAADEGWSITNNMGGR